MSLLPSGAIESGGYDINNSLRFRSSASAYMTWLPTAAGNRKTWTLSFWMKAGDLATDNQTMFSTSLANDRIGFQTASNSREMIIYLGAGVANLATTQVFRDPSAWYHIVYAIDTTQATAANRIKVYVNGNQVTSFVTSTYPTLNYDTGFGTSAYTQAIGRRQSTSNLYYDGYLTDINFIDGQALTPSSFGQTDAVTGSWVAKKYTGTYGTNGFYLPFKNTNATGFSSYYGSFNGSSKSLSIANNTAFALTTGDWTIEGLIYPTSNSAFQCIYCNGFPVQIYFNAANIECYVSSTAGSGTYFISGLKGPTQTLQLNTWSHFALVKNGNIYTAYVNGIAGVSQTSATTPATPTAPSDIGTFGPASPPQYYFNGYISNFRIVKGTAVYTSNFIPPTSALTNITNTSLLTLQNSTIIDNSSNAFTITNNGSVTTTSATVGTYPQITSDSSGNNNNWVSNNINYVTAGTTYDAIIDSPTNTSATVANYAVWNPLERTAATYSEANLKVVSTSSAAPYNMTSTIQFPTTGKWYCEVEGIKGANNPAIGMGNNIPSDQFAMYRNTGVYLNGGISGIASSGTPATWTTGDIIGIAYDASAGTLSFYKNGTLQSGGFTSIPATGYFVAVRADSASGDGGYLNCGQRPFTYTAPSGFVALNTFNLPSSTIPKGNKYMDATLYTGAGNTSTSITNASGFKPDFVWTKVRSTTYNHYLYDSVRGTGTGASLISNLTDAEGSNATNANLSSFNSNGWTIGTTSATNAMNASGQTFVGWQWQAGQGTTSSNTSGTITSTVSVNTTAGFSIVRYSGNGTSGATVGHGLGVAPKMVIAKTLNTAGYNWPVYHSSLTSSSYVVYLDLTDGQSISTNKFNGVAPSSTVVTLGNHGTNVSGTNNQVLYCWAEIAGFSKFGSYTGNASNDGVFVYCGFRPKFIMMKSSSSVSSWAIVDTSRDTYNLAGQGLDANTSAAEFTPASSGYPLDILSNGFKLRYSGQPNAAQTYIFMAFAENPFKNANAR